MYVCEGKIYAAGAPRRSCKPAVPPPDAGATRVHVDLDVHPPILSFCRAHAVAGAVHTLETSSSGPR